VFRESTWHDAMRPPELWQRDEAAAHEYERYTAPKLLDPWVPELLAAVTLRREERVLDVACGTGLVTRSAARVVGERGAVVGVDLHPPMLAVARATPPMRGAGPIDWRDGDATALPVADASFDVVLCQQGLQFFADRRAALAEMRRALVPLGRVGLVVWGVIERNPYFQALADALHRHLGAEAGERLRSPFVLGDIDGLRALLADAGFEPARVRSQAKAILLPPLPEFVPRHLSSTSLAAQVAAMSAAERRAVVDEIATALRPFARGGGVRAPFEVLVAAGQAPAAA
jgi:SAM-dependent methyltransferase